VVVEDGLWDKRRNRPEAEKVVSIIKKVLREKDPEETIGVITFNTAQRNLIEDLLDEALFKKTRFASRLEKEMNRFEESEDQSLFVKNIENVQGDERDIIIFSTAYAKNREGKFLRQFGWLNNEGGQNRLNVAISRAKKKIFMVTSFYPESLHVEDLKSAGPKRLKAYLQYCHAISRGNYDGAKQVLEQLSDSEILMKDGDYTALQRSVLDRLKKEKLEIHPNIGIGKYKLDFAIEDETTKDYTLGIILDMNEESHASDVRDSLYHQEKYLKARGWNIKRIFAPNWYKDANKEMREIRKILRETT
jgi:very-short-patch-repair endonuclease